MSEASQEVLAQLQTANDQIAALNTTVAGQGAVITKVGDEIRALQAAVNSANDIDAIKAAVAALATNVSATATAVAAQGVALQGLDDLNPDAPA